MGDAICELLSTNLPLEKQKLQTYYQQNNVLGIRDVLHKLDGTFRICVIPLLQKTRNQLHEAIRQTDKLDTLNSLFKAFYHEIDVFLAQYAKLQKAGKV